MLGSTHTAVAGMLLLLTVCSSYILFYSIPIMSPLRFRGALLPCLLGLVAWEATLPDVVGGLPMKVLIRRGEPECVYDTLEAG